MQMRQSELGCYVNWIKRWKSRRPDLTPVRASYAHRSVAAGRARARASEPRDEDLRAHRAHSVECARERRAADVGNRQEPCQAAVLRLERRRALSKIVWDSSSLATLYSAVSCSRLLRTLACICGSRTSARDHAWRFLQSPAACSCRQISDSVGPSLSASAIFFCSERTTRRGLRRADRLSVVRFDSVICLSCHFQRSTPL
jgi:hypothetical protein